MKHFLISVSVSKVDYREKVEIMIFIATKTPWPWVSYLTRFLVRKALEKSCKLMLLCSLILKAGFQEADFSVFGRCILGQCACYPVQKSAQGKNSACWKAAYVDSYRCFVANYYDMVGTIWNNRLSSGNWQIVAHLSWHRTPLLPPPHSLTDKVC